MSRIKTLLLFSSFFVLGSGVSIYKNNAHGKFLGKQHVFIRIESNPIEKNKTFQFEGNILNDSIQSKSIIYIQKDSSSACLKLGDVIECITTFNEIQDISNSSFNYKDWLANSYIYSQAYIPSTKWKYSYTEKTLQYYAQQVRTSALQKIQDYGLSKSATAIIQAICFGDKSAISADTKNSFTKAGAMHVLAVSGLHVGIIASLLFILALPFKLSKYKFIPTIFIILGIWIYAFITGLSPSVTRAAIMFSLFSISIMLRRQTSVYNTLAIAAFISIFISPNTIYLVGFQLSYIAVISILYGADKLIKTLYIRSKIIKYVWGIIAISLIVNIGVLPLTAYYFKVIPIYGLLTSVFVIPLAFIIISLALMSFIPLIQLATIFILEYVIWLLLYGMNIFSNMPFNQISIDFTFANTVEYYAVVLLGIWIWETRKQYRIDKNITFEYS